MKRILIMSLLVGGLVLAIVPAWAGPAGETFAAGRSLLTKGDFDGALKAFRAAGKADPENQEYAQQYAMLR